MGFQKYKYCFVFIVGLFSLLFISCAGKKQLVSTSAAQVDYLSAEERRRFDYFFLEGERLKNLNKQDDAFELFTHAAAIDTASAAVKFELASYYLKLNRPQNAFDLLQKATTAEPDNYWYSMMYANLAQNMNQFDDAIEVYNRLVPTHSDDAELIYMLAEAYSQKGDILKSIETLNKLEQVTGMVETLSMAKYKLYKSIPDDDKAFNEIEKLIQAYPTEVKYVILLGDLYLDSGNLDKALANYNKAYEIEPDNGYLMVSKSNYYTKIGDKKAAEQFVREALTNAKLDVETKMKILTAYLTAILQNKESLEKTDELFKALFELHPQEVKLYNLYAELLMAQNKLDQAKEELEIATGLDPNDANTWMQLMGVDLKKMNFNGVIKTASKALVYLPEKPDFYFYQGIAYAQLNQETKALEVLEEGLSKIDKTNNIFISEFYGQIGDVYQKTGKIKKAYESYDKALQYNDKNIPVLNNYSYFLSLDGSDLRKAERMSAKTVELEPNNSTYLDTYAWIFFKQGNYTLAKFYLESAMSKGGDKSAEIVDHYGDVLYKEGNVDEAVKYWEKAVSLGKKSKVLEKKIATKTYIEE